ncbi:MAG: hypothetical protein NZ934_03585 [Hadesarchaea archaeon]|nr:hypothetical protein [Hadesarchaea archaeon]
MLGTTAIGFAVGIRATLDADIIKAYALGDDKPVVLESGNKTFRFTIEKMYIDNTYANNVLSGAKVTIEVRPSGTGSGRPRIVFNNSVLTSWELTIDQDGVIMESVEGEAPSVTIGTQS